MKGYDTDSDSECEIGFHRRKNRNPKAFYQQMKKNNKTVSIKAMKKRAKEGMTIVYRRALPLPTNQVSNFLVGNQWPQPK
jgi:hypothetical protein